MPIPRLATVNTPAADGAALGRPQLSVVIPVYNERYTVREIVRRVQAVDIPKEVIIVDDGSTDGTYEILAKIQSGYTNVRLFRQEPNQGKGAALRRGIQQAEGEFLIVQDADLEYNPEEYPQLLAPLLSGEADAVYGSRFTAGHRRVHLFWHSVANRLLTLLTNLLTNLNLTDMETCYKVFRTELIKSVPLRSNRFGFEPEVTVKIAKLGWRLFEVPISYSGRDYAEGKKIGAKDVWTAVWMLVKHTLVSDVGDVGRHTLARMRELGAYNRTMFDLFASHLGQRVLEVGSGSGNLSRFILDREKAVLSDFDQEYLRLLRRRFGTYENVEIRQLDLSTFTADELRASRLDSIICLNVLEHIEDDRRVLAELFATLEPGGCLVVLVPAHAALYCEMDRNLGHYRRYTREELAAKFEEAGFVVERKIYFNWVGAIGWFIVGKILRRRHITKVATRGYRLVAALQGLERYVPFGFGLSTVVIGRRPEQH
jgi:glycosyltransferase involved in cell wall biosynthesis